MRTGIIGAGRMGQALAMRCAATGHQVMISNSRGPHTLAGVVAALEGNVRAGTVAQAVLDRLWQEPSARPRARA